MKKVIAGLLIAGLLIVSGLGAVFAQQGPNSIALTKIPEAVLSLDLFSLHSQRAVYDHDRQGIPYNEDALCDASGEYTIHYWRTEIEVGAMYMDGCVDSTVSQQVIAALDAMDMDSVPDFFTVASPTGDTYDINLFCTGTGKTVRLTGDFAHCE